MAITELDIKLMKSERLTDYDDGGGMMTGLEVVDGQVNNLFPDISQLDRTYGRLSLRKAFPSVRTANADAYYGVHAILTDAPDDPNVNVTLFTTKSWSDERLAAQDRIESYLTSGAESRWRMWGNHITGQKAISAWGMADAPSPEVGEVYLLSTEAAGYVAKQQYVRVTKLTSRTTMTFEDAQGLYERDVVVFEISNALRDDYYGLEVLRATNTKPPSLIRSSQVADAAQYFGVKPLSANAVIGDLTVTVDSPYAPLVPSAQVETPMVDVTAGMGKVVHVQSGASGSLTYAETCSASVAPYQITRYLGMGLAVGSLSINVGGYGALKDDGNGLLAPTVTGGATGFYGTVDYSSGAVTIERDSAISSSAITWTATPAAAASLTAHTSSTAITIQNRAFNYVTTVDPKPASGTVTVDYRTMGKWIRLFDDGLGNLTGNTNEGTGTINYATGSIIATLGALPDIDSAVIFSWGTPVHYTRRDGDVNIKTPDIEINLTNPGVTPGSLYISWLSGGLVKTAHDNSSGGFTGDASGTIDYASGATRLLPAAIPDYNSTITVDYTHGVVTSESPELVVAGGIATLTIAGAPIKPRSLRMQIIVSGHVVTLGDDGNGYLTSSLSGLVGTVNYTTGVVSFNSVISLPRSEWTW